jgi:NADPH:quinone reductase-like Zn-dependent oxidoreductase
MPTTARVARIHEYGPPEVLRFEDIVVGEPGDDEALIRNTVIGLNFVDVYYRRGSLPDRRHDLWRYAALIAGAVRPSRLGAST